MESLTIRGTSADLPVLDPDELTAVDVLEPTDGPLSLFSYTGKDLRALELRQAQLFDGRISGITAERVDLDRLRMSSVVFSGCSLTETGFTAGNLSGAVFDDCVLRATSFQPDARDS